VQAGMGGFVFLLVVFFLRDKPPTPPSATADLKMDAPGSFKQSIVDLLKNKNMLLLMMAFGQI
jgi:hypothetical protein